MKGISPVVATVLLIAIAVIAAIGVWYWVGSYTGKPAVGVDQKSFSIEGCDGTKVLIRNTGAIALSKDADIYQNEVPVGTIAISRIGGVLGPGAIEYINIGNISDSSQSINVGNGVFNVIDDDYPGYTFTCA